MRTLIALAALLLTIMPVGLAQGIRYEQFDVPGALLTRPFGVNALGHIVGLYRDARNASHGFLRSSDSSYVTIDYPGAIFTNATGVNAREAVVGRWTDAAGINHGYMRTRQGQFTQIDPPAPCVATTQQTVIHGINDIGDLVGRCFDAAGKELGWFWRHDRSFRVFDDPVQATSDAWMPTNTGIVVGDYRDAALFVHGFIWSEREGFVTLDFGNSQTGVRDMNERGDITGIYAEESGRLTDSCCGRASSRRSITRPWPTEAARWS
jgi:hypothetical protein